MLLTFGKLEFIITPPDQSLGKAINHSQATMPPNDSPTTSFARSTERPNVKPSAIADARNNSTTVRGNSGAFSLRRAPIPGSSKQFTLEPGNRSRN
jgi:hypothetical protein